jgi:hypothetical protein
MTKYIIKTNKKGVGMYDHNLFDDKGNLMKDEDTLENGATVKETLYYHNIQIVPFLRHSKIDTSKLEIEVSGK